MILNKLRDKKTGKLVEIPDDVLSPAEIKHIEDAGFSAGKRLKEMAKEVGMNPDNLVFLHIK